MNPRLPSPAPPLVQRLVRHRLAKFVLVGVTNNLAGYGIFVLLSLLGAAAIPAMTVSYGIGMIISFVGNRRWTFNHQARLGPAAFRFLTANAAGYGLNLAILWIFVNRLGLSQIPVQLFATACVAVCTFLAMRLWVFRAGPEYAGE